MSNHTMPPLPIVDGHFFIDNSTLETYTKCRRSYEYNGLRRRILRESRAGLEFGKLLHECLELRYKWEGKTGQSALDTTFDKEVEAKQVDLIEAFFRRTDLPDNMEYRTSAYAQEVILLYNKYYITEPFTVAKLADGTPLVETPFALELGTVDHPSGPVIVMWSGKIDLVSLWDNRDLMHVDHKSSKMGGERFFDDYILDQGQRGYAWALQRIVGQPVSHYVINGLICRKPTQTGTAIEFKRRRLPIDQDSILEWQENTLRLVEDLFRDHARAYFPMETAWCNGKFGACQYKDVCNVGRTGRGVLLYGNLFTDNTWSPLNDPHKTS